jgi:hypothetical protein
MVDEDSRGATAAYVLGGGLLLLALWAWSQTMWLLWWIGSAGVLLGVAIDGRPLAAGLVAVGTLIPFLAGLRSDRRYFLEYRHSVLELLGPDATPADAGPKVAALEAAGYRRIGVAHWHFGDAFATTILLIGPRADRVAGVGEHHAVTLESGFGNRVLVSTNDVGWPRQPDTLRQQIEKARAEAIAAAHERAIELLAARGIEPNVYATDAEALASTRASTERFVRFVSETPLRTYFRSIVARRTPDRVLGDDERSRLRIDEWLGGA